MNGATASVDGSVEGGPVVPEFAVWLTNHPDRDLAGLAAHLECDPDFPWDQPLDAMGEYAAHAFTIDEVDDDVVNTLEAALGLYSAFVWRQRALTRLKAHVGADDHRVLAVEVLLALGRDGECDADQLLQREVDELDEIAGTTARTVSGAT